MPLALTTTIVGIGRGPVRGACCEDDAIGDDGMDTGTPLALGVTCGGIHDGGGPAGGFGGGLGAGRLTDVTACKLCCVWADRHCLGKSLAMAG